MNIALFQKIFGKDEAGNPKRSAFWTYQFFFAGKRIRVRTDLTDREAAVRLARADLKARQNGLTAQVEALIRPPAPPPKPPQTVANLISAYRKAPLEIKASTRRNNISSLRLLLRKARPELPPRPGSLNAIDPLDAFRLADLFTLATARAYFASWIRDEELNTAEILSAKISGNSIANQAVSMLADRALECYEENKNLQECLPILRDFRAALERAKFRRIAKRGLDLPNEAVIAKMIEAWQTLPVEKRDLFLAIGHELAFGLRIGEVAQARWLHWGTREGNPYFEGQIDDKKGSGYVCIRAINPYWKIMADRIEKENWRGENEEHVIPGTTSYRKDDLPRECSNWLRAFGWTGFKTNHRIRAWVGSQIAMKYGLYDASLWLRHSTIKITERHYSMYVTTANLTNKERIQTVYATQPNIIQLGVLEKDPEQGRPDGDQAVPSQG